MRRAHREERAADGLVHILYFLRLVSRAGDGGYRSNLQIEDVILSDLHSVKKHLVSGLVLVLLALQGLQISSLLFLDVSQRLRVDLLRPRLDLLLRESWHRADLDRVPLVPAVDAQRSPRTD